MHARPLARTCWLATLLAACGPTVEPPVESGTSSSSSTLPSTTEPVTTGPGLTATSGTSLTGADSTDSGLASESGVLFLVPGDIVCHHEGPGGSSTRCSFECDVWAQDCSAGEKCMPWANDGGEVWNASRCSPIDPDPVPVGGSCTVQGSAVTGVDDCELGAMCWGVDPETLQGTCVGFCDARRVPSTICTAPTQCLGLNDDEVPVCLTPCDPLADASCPDGEACRHVESDGGFYCLPLVGGHVDGSSQHCDDATCLPSQLCLDAGSLAACEAASCCTELCDTSDPSADAECAALDPALSCEPFYAPAEAPAGLELVGVCAVPM